ncbi:tRNA glutamyl-Q(34) synthetase GluQRS [Pigmentibacter sp. JX0631]|uniref:tRNA glutamyl-Q(34) synthetase GluQRS n=1 Tax=Pigmentibacter sp. JX0631 TaxID=2976982 RepID=UPI002469787B|nr:tRNA glutamyl-Q(34) synthetase GluQRS [Pigmentibacter sp. JX0631]WGL61381.1 tRNA glutamyl-Q(34) synthetase GluQRS [Pigmentibacter sp. JX0631]
MTIETNYIGRFAPSPTGDLHFGSLVTALASYIRAKFYKGKWLLRIEDVDIYRAQKGSVNSILNSLSLHGFEWDSEVIYQSKRSHIYREYLHELLANKQAYVCNCSRKDLQKNRKNNETGEFIYQGTCLDKKNPFSNNQSYRIKTNSINISFYDHLQGSYEQNIAKEIGDFIIWRKENFASYQLAVVIDDELQNVTEIVRGYDLFFQTPRQIFLQNVLNFKGKEYVHIPLVTNEFGQKLSKQNKAKSLNFSTPQTNLIQALDFLGLEKIAIDELRKNFSSCHEIIEYAVNNLNFKFIQNIKMKAQ